MMQCNYSCNYNEHKNDQDEIPDIIPKYGYLDDITVARWIINQINNELPEIGVA